MTAFSAIAFQTRLPRKAFFFALQLLLSNRLLTYAQTTFKIIALWSQKKKWSTVYRALHSLFQKFGSERFLDRPSAVCKCLFMYTRFDQRLRGVSRVLAVEWRYSDELVELVAQWAGLVFMWASDSRRLGRVSMRVTVQVHLWSRWGVLAVFMLVLFCSKTPCPCTYAYVRLLVEVTVSKSKSKDKWVVGR